MSGNQVTEHSDVGGIDRDSWARLSARSPASVIGSPQWLEAAFATTHRGMEPLLLASEGENGLTGLLPLAVSGDGARLVGAPYNDLSDVLVAPGYESEATEALLEATKSLAGRGIPVTLHSIDPRGVLPEVDAGVGAFEWSVERPAPEITLDCDLEEKVSGRRRRTWGNRRRRIEQDHAVEFRVLTGGRDVLAALPVFERLRESRRQATGRPPERPPVALVAEAVKLLAAEGRAVAFFEMLVDRQPVASDLYLLDPPVGLMWLRGLDPAWREFPCGHLLLCWTARYLRSCGYEVLDMGRGAEPYKFIFGASDRVLLRGETTPVEGAAGHPG